MTDYKTRAIRAGRSTATKEDVVNLVRAYPELRDMAEKSGMEMPVDENEKEAARLRKILEQMRQENKQRDELISEVNKTMKEQNEANRETIQRLIDIIEKKIAK